MLAYYIYIVISYNTKMSNITLNIIHSRTHKHSYITQKSKSLSIVFRHKFSKLIPRSSQFKYYKMPPKRDWV